MSRLVAIRVVFACVLLALPAQLAFTHAVGEPYPGLTQPRFAGTPMVDGVVTSTRPVVTTIDAAGNEEVIAFDRLMPTSRIHPATMFNKTFGDEGRATDPETVAWLNDRLDKVTPERVEAQMRIEFVERKVTPYEGDREVAAETTKTVLIDLGRP